MLLTKWMTTTVLCLGASLALHADTLASFAASGAANTNPNYLGEKFTTSGTGTYRTITFDFISTSGNPYAIGTAYLLTQEYLGSPTSLSSATAGYLGSAAASSGFYSFASNVTLQAGTAYFLYENALAPMMTIAGDVGAPPTVEYYYSYSGGSFIGQPNASAAFTVTGTPVGSISQTPEPSSIVLLASGLLSTVALARRRYLAKS